MKLFIPVLGSRFVLTKPWTFKLKDDYRNEKFWKSIHGTPDRKVYYYGWAPGGQETSPVPTATCKQEGKRPAKPKTTTFPKGSVLHLERLYMRKGASDFDSMSFRITKGGLLPAGRFWVNITEINGKLDVQTETIDKYPNGRWDINIDEGQKYMCRCRGGGCTCDRTSWPKYQNNFITWISKPNASRHGGRVASVEHSRDNQGKDDLTNSSYHGGRGGYSKSFDNMEDCLSWARKKKFTDQHIDAFILRYEEKKAQALADTLAV